jgi:uncharacterized SAM-binding protein YcdF (DUF218 family)
VRTAGLQYTEQQVAAVGERSEARHRWTRRARWVLALGTAAILLYLLSDRLLPLAARFLDVSKPPAPADYVLVLGGGNSTRPFVAAALVKAGLARQVLLCRDTLLPDAEDGIVPPEYEIDRRVLQARGVAEEQITVLDGECTGTFDEAQALARFLEGKPGSAVAVVTTTYHTRRARAVLRRTLALRGEGVRLIGAPTDGYDASNWWHYEAGVEAYGVEYVKLAYYAARYDLRWYHLVALLGIVGLWLACRRLPLGLGRVEGTPGCGRRGG